MERILLQNAVYDDYDRSGTVIDALEGALGALKEGRDNAC